MNEITMMMNADELILSALREDITSEDITTNSVMREYQKGEVELICKQDGVLAGLAVFKRVFELLDKNTEFEFYFKDGDEVKNKDKIGVIRGDIRVLLSGERVALNYLQRMSGVATYTKGVAKLLEGTKTKLLDTRKTTPNMRVFEKYSVKVGGGHNHRYNLSDGILLKDNHIGAAGSITKAVQMAKEYAPFVRKIEIEVENLEMFKEALEAGADIIMLDNMTTDEIKEAIKIIDGKAEIEVSGTYIKKENEGMEVRDAANAKDVKYYTTDRLREEFHIANLFTKDNIRMVYSHIDRIIVIGMMPIKLELKLEAGKELAAEYFLERRELGCINIGGPGVITIDGEIYDMNPRDGIYVGRGHKDLKFKSLDEKNPAKFYITSCPAHTEYPTVKIDITKARKVPCGSVEDCNKRVINQYIHPDVIKSCQLAMGLTELEVGSNWNTMPCHTHDRRMEVYLYLDMGANDAVFHMMGEPKETRHIIMHNEEAVISPSWSIHSGVGTKNYSFIWAMCGENQEFTDMDHIETKELR